MGIKFFFCPTKIKLEQLNEPGWYKICVLIETLMFQDSTERKHTKQTNT